MVGAVKWVTGVHQARWRPGEVEVETVAGCRSVQWVSAIAVGHRRVRVPMSGSLLVTPNWEGIAISMWWVEARCALNTLQCPGRPPTKSDPAQMSTCVAEKPCVGGRHGQDPRSVRFGEQEGKGGIRWPLFLAALPGKWWCHLDTLMGAQV